MLRLQTIFDSNRRGLEGIIKRNYTTQKGLITDQNLRDLIYQIIESLPVKIIKM